VPQRKAASAKDEMREKALRTLGGLLKGREKGNSGRMKTHQLAKRFQCGDQKTLRFRRVKESSQKVKRGDCPLLSEKVIRVGAQRQRTLGIDREGFPTLA